MKFYSDVRYAIDVGGVAPPQNENHCDDRERQRNAFRFPYPRANSNASSGEGRYSSRGPRRGMRQDRSPSLGKIATTCTHWQDRLRNPPTHIPDSADPGSPPSPNPCRPAVASSHANRRGEASAQPGTNRSRAQSAVPGNARRRRRGNELTWRSAAGVLTCRASEA